MGEIPKKKNPYNDYSGLWQVVCENGERSKEVYHDAIRSQYALMRSHNPGKKLWEEKVNVKA